MKASLIIAHYEKYSELPNTLCGLLSELDRRDVETIFIDDASLYDPKPVVAKILSSAKAPWKYERLEKRLGSRRSRGYGVSLMDPTSEIVLTLSSDIILVSPGIIEAMINSVEDGYVALPEVKNMPVAECAWENIDFFKKTVLTNWNMYAGGKAIYQGPSRPDGRLFLFCAALTKKTALELGFDGLSCDLAFSEKMKSFGVKPIWLDSFKAVHQMHPWVQHPCADLGACRFSQSCVNRGVQKL